MALQPGGASQTKHKSTVLKALLEGPLTGGLYPHFGPTLNELNLVADRVLFNKVLNNRNHLLNTLLPPTKITPYNLRPRAHDRVLPLKTFSLAKNFLYRMLFSDLQ